MYHPIFRPGAQRQIQKIGEADLVIGLPTYRNADIASQVAQVILAGVSQYYPDLQTVLINADIGHEATTRKAISSQVSTNGHTCNVVAGRYHGLSGQGSAIAALLDAALALDRDQQSPPGADNPGCVSLGQSLQLQKGSPSNCRTRRSNRQNRGKP